MWNTQVSRPDTLRLKCDGTREETRFRLSAKRTSPFKSAGASVQSTAVSRGVRISGSNAGYNMFRGSVKSTGYALDSPVSPSFPPPPLTSPCAITFQLESTRQLTSACLNTVCRTRALPSVSLFTLLRPREAWKKLRLFHFFGEAILVLICRWNQPIVTKI